VAASGEPANHELTKPRRWQQRGVALVGALALCTALWELWLAPLRPGGSWLALKALPLACLWFPLARGNRRARQAATLLLPLYAGEGIVRALTEPGRHSYAATLATVLAIAALGAILQSFRAEAQAIAARRPAIPHD
jgi:uncharacterized membrane protein